MSKRDPSHTSIRRHMWVGVTLCTLLIGGVGGWGASVDLAGAVIAPGVMVVESNVKKVQHPQGGVIGEINVKDGDLVRAGDIVVRLDDTQIRANLGIITSALDEFGARMARLTAEQNGLDEVLFPDTLMDRADQSSVAAILEGEKRLFDLRREARDGEKGQLSERVLQYREEIKGLEGQAEAKALEIGLVRKELAAVRELFDRNLVTATRVTSLEREEVRLGGEHGQLIAAIAQARGRIAEMELQIIQVDQNLRSAVTRELGEARAKTAELSERRLAAEDELRRVDIRAPQDGMVHQLAAHTIGGVVGPGETMMLIVPNDDALIAEAKVAPSDIDQLHIGQEAVLRLSAFNQRTTPEITGNISGISADLAQDDRTGVQYYVIKIEISEEQLQRLADVRLVPGMPVEAFVQTSPRTALSYLAKPLIDQAARAFLEE